MKKDLRPYYTKNTHRLSKERKVRLWSRGRLMQTTKCGLTLADRNDPNDLYHSRYRFPLGREKPLGKKTFILSGWDFKLVRIVSHPTCKVCSR